MSRKRKRCRVDLNAGAAELTRESQTIQTVINESQNKNESTGDSNCLKNVRKKPDDYLVCGTFKGFDLNPVGKSGEPERSTSTFGSPENKRECQLQPHHLEKPPSGKIEEQRRRKTEAQKRYRARLRAKAAAQLNTIIEDVDMQNVPSLTSNTSRSPDEASQESQFLHTTHTTATPIQYGKNVSADLCQSIHDPNSIHDVMIPSTCTSNPCDSKLKSSERCKKYSEKLVLNPEELERRRKGNADSSKRYRARKKKVSVYDNEPEKHMNIQDLMNNDEFETEGMTKSPAFENPENKNESEHFVEKPQNILDVRRERRAEAQKRYRARLREKAAAKLNTLIQEVDTQNVPSPTRNTSRSPDEDSREYQFLPTIHATGTPIQSGKNVSADLCKSINDPKPIHHVMTPSTCTSSPCDSKLKSSERCKKYSEKLMLNPEELEKRRKSNADSSKRYRARKKKVAANENEPEMHINIQDLKNSGEYDTEGTTNSPAFENSENKNESEHFVEEPQDLLDVQRERKAEAQKRYRARLRAKAAAKLNTLIQDSQNVPSPTSNNSRSPNEATHESQFLHIIQAPATPIQYGKNVSTDLHQSINDRNSIHNVMTPSSCTSNPPDSNLKSSESCKKYSERLRLNPEELERRRKSNADSSKRYRARKVTIDENEHEVGIHSQMSPTNREFSEVSDNNDIMEDIPERRKQVSRRLFTTADYETLLLEFEIKKRQSPIWICCCCGGLFYKESTRSVKEETLIQRGCTAEQTASIMHLSQISNRLCLTCYKHVFTTKTPNVPRLALCNGFEFPEIPDELTGLTPLEERLVSPRLPFMQIRALGCDRQSSLKGNVVNVETDLDVCAMVLPRRFNDTSTVEVKLMRKMAYTVPYMHEVIRPLKVFTAAKYLSTTELFASENILLSHDWSRHLDEETLDFTADPLHFTEGEREDIVPNEGAHSEYEDSPEDRWTAYLDTVPSEETLIFSEQQSAFKAIRIAPAEGNFPLPLFSDLKAEVLSFPTIYCGKDRTFTNGIRVTYTDIAKSALRNYDRRACKPTSVLYMFKRSYNEKIYNAMQICLRKQTGKETLTARSVKSQDTLRTILEHDDGYKVFKNMRTSPCYWKDKQKKALAMVRQVSTPRIFLTLSAAETKWKELIIMLKKILHGADITEQQAVEMPFDEKIELIRQDPVTCMRHFDHRFRALLTTLLKKDGGVFAPFKMLDYFCRLEFQLRGSPHIHSVLWMEGAPEYIEGDIESAEKCCAFIDKFITCERCEDGKMATLIAYQLHEHSQTCWKKSKNKCRFSYPKPPLDKTQILTPLPDDFDPAQRKVVQDVYKRLQESIQKLDRRYKEVLPFAQFLSELQTSYDNYILALRSSIKRATVFLKRSTAEMFVNSYNRMLLECWEANMDIQYILDPYACVRYCVGYILKAETSCSKLLQKTMDDIKNGNVAAEDKLKRFASTLINGSEISAQEAAAFILAIPNTYCSRTDIYLNTVRPEERVSFLKSKEELAELDDDSTDVCASNILDYYVLRPEQMDDTTLSEFASMYTVTKIRRAEKEKGKSTGEGSSSFSKKWKLAGGTHTIQKRTQRKVIRFRHYSKAEDPVNYYREQIMLFLPWRDEGIDILSKDPLQLALKHWNLILENSKPFYANRTIDDDVLLNMYRDAELDCDIEEECSVVENEFQLVDEDETIHGFSDPVNKSSAPQRTDKFLPPRFIVQEDYQQIMRTLNDKQRRFVLDIMHRIKTEADPFHIFLSGGAGVGKSQTVTAVVQSILRYNKRFPTEYPDEICVLVSAPTGKAAFNVGGMTLHSSFNLPCSNAASITDLKPDKLSSLLRKLKNTKLFIIDEISMVGLKAFYQVHFRLQQLYSNTLPFGGRSIIVVGDMRQLPPVAAKFVFEKPNHLSNGELGNYLWDLFDLYVLDEIMRQKGDFEFCKALNNMAEGKMDAQDVALIRSREISDNNLPPDEAIWLFHTNKECESYNNLIHEKLNTDSATSFAYERIEGTASETQKKKFLDYAKTLSVQQCSGLRHSVHLQVGAEYFISTNVDVSDGLFNGATGTLMMIEYGSNADGQSLPKRVWIDFKNPQIGVNRRQAKRLYQSSKGYDPQWVPIERITMRISLTGQSRAVELIRTQIPIVAANAMTINKAQGSSLKNVVVSVRKKLSREQLYVACSRATTKSGLFIDGEFQEPNSQDSKQLKVTKEMDRLRTKPTNLTLKFFQDFSVDFCKLYYHNIESYLPHFRDLFSDNCAKDSDIIAIVEPQILETDVVYAYEFDIAHRTNCKTSRNSEGALVLKRHDMELSNPEMDTYTDINGHCLFLNWKIGCVDFMMTYKSPNYAKTKYLDLMAAKIRGRSQLLLFGDVNINLKNDIGEAFLLLMKQHDLKSVVSVNESTTNGNSNLDVCFTNIEHVRASIYESLYSYHKPLCVLIPKNTIK